MPAESDLPWILVVDDEIPNLDTFRRVFRREFNVVAAASGTSALERLNEHSFDVAFVDYAMPGMTGVQFLDLARMAQPTMARVMLTAFGDLEEVRRAKAHGLVAAVIMKPWEKEDVIRWVDQVQKLSAMKRSLADLKSTTS